MGKENFNMDDWVMKVDSVENINDLRNVKDYIHYKLRMEVRKEISDNSIRIKEQELEALKKKRDKELNQEWTPDETYHGSGTPIEAVKELEEKLITKNRGASISPSQAKRIAEALNKDRKDK